MLDVKPWELTSYTDMAKGKRVKVEWSIYDKENFIRSIKTDFLYPTDKHSVDEVMKDYVESVRSVTKGKMQESFHMNSWWISFYDRGYRTVYITVQDYNRNLTDRMWIT